MTLVADLHLHSPFSLSTSPAMTLENLFRWAQLKGITLIGTGDFIHPAWLAELRRKLVPAEAGLYRLKRCHRTAEAVPEACRKSVRFVLSGEVSCIYTRAGKTRRVHHLILARDLGAVRRIHRALSSIANLGSDGRPILKLDSRDLLQIVLDASDENILIPAHVWTPHYSLFGAFSAFDTVEACFGPLASEIVAVETGLSSDPPMNRRLSHLDRLTLVSNSDAHSPARLMREANLLNMELSYPALREALRADRKNKGFLGTIEYFPEEGKYHCDGHRACGIRTTPAETRKHNGRCPTCGKKIVVGVLHRLEALADRAAIDAPSFGKRTLHLVPLQEVLSEVLGVGVSSKRVQQAYLRVLSVLGDEFTVLTEAPLEAIEATQSPRLAEAIRRVRQGQLHISPGYDGVYGSVRIFDGPAE